MAAARRVSRTADVHIPHPAGMPTPPSSFVHRHALLGTQRPRLRLKAHTSCNSRSAVPKRASTNRQRKRPRVVADLQPWISRPGLLHPSWMRPKHSGHLPRNRTLNNPDAHAHRRTVAAYGSPRKEAGRRARAHARTGAIRWRRRRVLPRPRGSSAGVTLRAARLPVHPEAAEWILLLGQPWRLACCLRSPGGGTRARAAASRSTVGLWRVASGAFQMPLGCCARGWPWGEVGPNRTRERYLIHSANATLNRLMQY